MHFAEQLRPGVAKIPFDDGKRFLANGHNTLLVAFANAANAPNFRIQIAGAETDELGHAQAGRVQNFEHGAVPKADGSLHIRLGEETLDFLEAKIARQSAVDLRGFQIYRRIFANELVDLRETEKIPHGAQVPR